MIEPFWWSYYTRTKHAKFIYQWAKIGKLAKRPFTSLTKIKRTKEERMTEKNDEKYEYICIVMNHDNLISYT